MKLGPHMHHLNTVHLHKSEGVSEWAGGRRMQKTTKKCQEINKILTLTLPKNIFKNAIKVGIILLLSLIIWLWFWGNKGGGGFNPPCGGGVHPTTRSELLHKKAYLKNFTKFIRKQPHMSLF